MCSLRVPAAAYHSHNCAAPSRPLTCALTCIPPFCCRYDAKLWQFAAERWQPGDCIWNVGKVRLYLVYLAPI